VTSAVTYRLTSICAENKTYRCDLIIKRPILFLPSQSARERLTLNINEYPYELKVISWWPSQSGFKERN